MFLEYLKSAFLYCYTYMYDVKGPISGPCYSPTNIILTNNGLGDRQQEGWTAQLVEHLYGNPKGTGSSPALVNLFFGHSMYAPCREAEYSPSDPLTAASHTHGFSIITWVLFGDLMCIIILKAAFSRKVSIVMSGLDFWHVWGLMGSD